MFHRTDLDSGCPSVHRTRLSMCHPGLRPVNDVGQTGFSARLLQRLQSIAWRANERTLLASDPISPFRGRHSHAVSFRAEKKRAGSA